MYPKRIYLGQTKKYKVYYIPQAQWLFFDPFDKSEHSLEMDCDRSVINVCRLFFKAKPVILSSTLQGRLKYTLHSLQQDSLQDYLGLPSIDESLKEAYPDLFGGPKKEAKQKLDTLKKKAEDIQKNHCDDSFIVEIKHDKTIYDSSPLYQACSEGLVEIRKIQRQPKPFPKCPHTGEQLELVIRHINCKYGVIFYCERCHSYMMRTSLFFWDDIDGLLKRHSNDPKKYSNTRNQTRRQRHVKKKIKV